MRTPNAAPVPVSVVIPYHGADPYRARNLHLILDLYREGRADWRRVDVVTSGGLDGRAALTSAARNLGARRSKADVIVFNDADSLVDPYWIRTAAAAAADGPGPVWAFVTYQRLDQATTENVCSAGWESAFTAPVAEELAGSWSAGCVAIRRDCFLEVGGFDLSWREWCEDLDFASRCGERWPLRRVAGELVHLWHPRPAGGEHTGSEDEARYLERWGGAARG